jgi:hypothetical protein
MNFHSKDCALRHNGVICDCGYVEHLSKKEIVIQAALSWRENWIDQQDEAEMQKGCQCEVCQLVRAVDSLTRKDRDDTEVVCETSSKL